MTNPTEKIENIMPTDEEPIKLLSQYG